MTAAQKNRGLQIGASLLGLGLFGFIFWKIGLTEVSQHLYSIGWLAPQNT